LAYNDHLFRTQGTHHEINYTHALQRQKPMKNQTGANEKKTRQHVHKRSIIVVTSDILKISSAELNAPSLHCRSSANKVKTVELIVFRRNAVSINIVRLQF
jgi:hypothetical protein